MILCYFGLDKRRDPEYSSLVELFSSFCELYPAGFAATPGGANLFILSVDLNHLLRNHT